MVGSGLRQLMLLISAWERNLADHTLNAIYDNDCWVLQLVQDI
jgi:hypothetical protein